MRVSVLVCTKGRPVQAAALVELLQRQTRRAFEILVVEGTAEAALRDRLAGKAGVTYIHQSDHRGLTHARNEGARRARGDVLVCLDDDLEPGPAFLEALVTPLETEHRLGGAGGIALLDPPPSAARRMFLRLFQRGPFRNEATFYQDDASAGHPPFAVRRLSGGVAAFRRAVFERFAWDENLRGYCHSEDMDFSYRVSKDFPLVLVPAARTPHASLGWNELDLRRRFDAKVTAFSYFYLKNLRGERRTRMAFAWLCVGILGEALFTCLRRRSLEPLLGALQGWKRLRQGLDGALGFVHRDPRRLTESERRGHRASGPLESGAAGAK